MEMFNEKTTKKEKELKLKRSKSLRSTLELQKLANINRAKSFIEGTKRGSSMQQKKSMYLLSVDEDKMNKFLNDKQKLKSMQIWINMSKDGSIRD